MDEKPREEVPAAHGENKEANPQTEPVLEAHNQDGLQLGQQPPANALPQQGAPAAAQGQQPAPAQKPANLPVVDPAQVPGPVAGKAVGGNPIVVPNLIGMTRDSAITALVNVQLALGDQTSVLSAMPIDQVTRSIPVAGTPVHVGDRVAIDICVAPALLRPRWWESTSSLFSVLGGGTLLALFAVFARSIYNRNEDLLQQLAKFDTSRGVITFLIAFTTVAIALILAISTVVLEDSPDNDKRFDRGKQVLTVLIGVLGTIVGFYFASDNKSTIAPTVTSSSIPTATVGTKYSDTTLTENGGTAPFKWTVKPELPKDLILSEAGVISGTPAKAVSDTTFTFTVLDANSKSDSKSLHLEVKAAGPAPTTPPPGATQGTQPPGKTQ